MIAMEPINLVTGLPGAGKTLFAIDLANKCRKEGLIPLNFNVNGLSSDIAESWPGPLDQWDGLTGNDLANAQQAAISSWELLPPKTVLLIDEAHRVFPVRPTHSKEPPHVNALAEIRHKGLRMVIIDQDPSTIDRFVKRRVGAHYHLVNRTGFNSARVFSNRGCVDNPRHAGAWSVGESDLWKYPKELFGRYKSASVHIKRKRLPRMFWVFVLGFVLIAGGVLRACTATSKDADIDTSVPAGVALPSSPASLTGITPSMFGAQGQGQGERLYLTADQWSHAHTPMVKGVPWSAPIFHDMPVTTVPDLHCIQVGSKCRCYTEQITRVYVDQQTCVVAVKDGVYNPYRRVSQPPPSVSVSPLYGIASADPSVSAGEPARPADTDGAAAAVQQRRASRYSHAAPPPVPAFQGIR